MKDATAYMFAAHAVEMAQDEPSDGGNRKRTFSGVAYSGAPLRHPAWGVLSIDLSEVELSDKTPVLIEHDRGQRAGVAKLSVDGGKLIVSGQLMGNEHGRAIAEESDDGFPWQLSVHAQPSSVEYVDPGATVTVNGHEVTGPAAVFRGSVIREVSFTPTGVDNMTSAAVMSHGANQHHEQHEDKHMAEELKKQIEELKASLDETVKKLDEANARAAKAEDALASLKREARLSAVKDLFASIGRDFSDDAAKPYVEMSDEMFSAVANDLKASKPKAPEHLFSEQATDGIDKGGADALLLN